MPQVRVLYLVPVGWIFGSTPMNSALTGVNICGMTLGAAHAGAAAVRVKSLPDTAQSSAPHLYISPSTDKGAEQSGTLYSHLSCADWWDVGRGRSNREAPQGLGKHDGGERPAYT